MSCLSQFSHLIPFSYLKISADHLAHTFLSMGKILIIDDEQAIRKALKEILEYESFEVTEAEDGPTALKLVDKDSFDLIFCDVKMPRMDGVEVLSKLKEKGGETPVVNITGHRKN